jgi:hypothetical protein
MRLNKPFCDPPKHFRNRTPGNFLCVRWLIGSDTFTIRTMIRFILRSIVFYQRSHLVVMLAVAVSTAVIGGALIVGDSVRASLREMTLSRLGGISQILHSPRFVREELADDLSRSGLDVLKTSHAAPALLLPEASKRKQRKVSCAAPHRFQFLACDQQTGRC